MRTRPVRILFTIPNFITAGSGRAMLNIIERLDRGRFDPAVCVMRKGGRLDREVERLGIPFLEAPFAIPAQPYATLLPRAWKAARPFRRLRPVLWHSFHYSDDYTEPLLAWFAGARGWVYTKKNMNWHRRSWYLRSLLADRIAAENTDMMRTFFDNRWLRGKTRLIPRGVETDRYHPAVSSALDLRGALRIPPTAVIAGCVAHLVPVKGHRTLVAAAAAVPGLHVLLAGEPVDREYAGSLERMVEALGVAERVHFLGGVAQVAAFLSELDIFVLPTEARGEGFGVSLLEAMACARACLASDVAGPRDVIEHGKSGWLVPAEDPGALARSLADLSAAPDLRRALGREARARVLERYTIEKEVAAHEALYEELLPGKRTDRGRIL